MLEANTHTARFTERTTAMNEERSRFMTLLGQPPARLNVEQVAWILNCQPHDIPVLVSARLLKPLGAPPPNGTKFFSTADVMELTKDRTWLVKMANAVCAHWQQKNARKKAAQLGTSAERAAHDPHQPPAAA